MPQLRYLQTLNSISAENNSTIVFPVPIDIMSSFMTGSTSTNPFTLTGSYEVKCLPLNLTVLLSGGSLEPVHSFVKSPTSSYPPSAASGHGVARERKVSIQVDHLE